MSNNSEWIACKFEGIELKHKGNILQDRCWYEWLDKYGNIEVLRIKLDVIHHFYPQSEIIKIDDVIAFREMECAE